MKKLFVCTMMVLVTWCSFASETNKCVTVKTPEIIDNTHASKFHPVYTKCGRPTNKLKDKGRPFTVDFKEWCSTNGCSLKLKAYILIDASNGSWKNFLPIDLEFDADGKLKSATKPKEDCGIVGS